MNSPHFSNSVTATSADFRGGVDAKNGVPCILHVFPGFGLGGSQRRFAAIANHFGKSFHHIVWPLNGGTDAKSLLQPDTSFEIVTDTFPKQGLLSSVRFARRLLHKLRPDVLVTYNWGAIEWAAGNIPKLVRHIHIEDGFGPEEAHRQIARRVWFRRLVLNRHSTVILPSQNLVSIATNIWRLKPSHMLYVPNGISCARFHVPPTPEMTAAWHGKGLVIGTVATLRKEKALERLIDAFAIVRQNRACHLVIAGDGGERANLENYAAARGLKEAVTFTGNITHPEHILGAFDVFAVSSDTEQMPLSILEAMAAGRAIASTDAGDIRSMVAPENCPFVVPLSADSLAQALGALLDDPARRARLGAANRAKAEQEFDEAKMFAIYGTLFKGL